MVIIFYTIRNDLQFLIQSYLVPLKIKTVGQVYSGLALTVPWSWRGTRHCSLFFQSLHITRKVGNYDYDIDYSFGLFNSHDFSIT
jgi:hypothetical protein